MTKTRKKIASPATRGGAKGKGGAGRRGGGSDSKGRQAIRGMIIGAAIIGGLALIFMMPIAGKTPFSHLLKAIGMDGTDAKPATATPKKAEVSPPRSVPPSRQVVRVVQPPETARAPGKAVAAVPAIPKLAANHKTRAPMETPSAADDAALDALVRRRTAR